MKNTKKIFGLIAFITAIWFFQAGCASQQTAGSNRKTLDQAIAEAAISFDERIEAGSKIALLNFNSPSDRFSSYVLDELTANLLDSGKLTVVDRKEIDLIRSEIDFQYSGEVADESIQAVGRRLGAQSIVSGSLTEIGGDYRIVIRVLGVQSASVVVQYRTDIAADKRVMALLEGGRTTAAAPAAKTPVAPAAQTQVAPTPSAPTPATSVTPAAASAAIAIEVTAKSGGKLFFQNKEVANLWENETHTIPIESPGTYTVKMVFADHTEERSVAINTRGIIKLSFGGVYTVGSAGPAGGIVFFDKGSYSDGWRYFEAASSDISGTAEWGAHEKQVSRTGTGRGSGKRNTQIITNYLRENGETGRAAQVAQEFRQGGYDDWFLPSKDELNLMYENLKQKGLGRFQESQYWSSSEDNAGKAWYQYFDSGRQSTGGYNWYGPFKNTVYRVRPIRQF